MTDTLHCIHGYPWANGCVDCARATGSSLKLCPHGHALGAACGICHPAPEHPYTAGCVCDRCEAALDRLIKRAAHLVCTRSLPHPDTAARPARVHLRRQSDHLPTVVTGSARLSPSGWLEVWDDSAPPHPDAQDPTAWGGSREAALARWERECRVTSRSYPPAAVIRINWLRDEWEGDEE